jgi:alkaline phosphatase D
MIACHVDARARRAPRGDRGAPDDAAGSARRRIKFFDGDRRGSMTARLDRREMKVDWRVADVVARPDARVRTLARFAVEAGRPGVIEL